MKIMRLPDFFERFDSARGMLTKIAESGAIGEPPDELDESGIRQAAFDILGGIIRFPSREYVRVKKFQKRKGDVVVCERLGRCYVPWDLIEDIRFAEDNYERYFGGKGAKRCQ
jgi:hypothetical protein